MTWQDPGGNPAPGGPGGPDDDVTRADWNLPELDALVGNGGGGAGSNAGQDAGPAAAPELPPLPASSGSTPPPWQPGSPPPSPGYGAPAPAPGYAPTGPGYPPGAAPGMAWAPPPSYTTPTGPGGGLEFAGTLVRFVAWLIDGLILGILGSVIAWGLSIAVLGTFDWSTTFGGFGRGVPIFDEGMIGRLLVVGLVGAALSAAIDLAYFALLWSSGARATLGMRLFGLQIGSAADGRTLTRGQAAKRWFAMGTWASILGVVPLIGGLVGLAQLAWYLVLLITTSANDRKMGLHDQFAGTAIVQRAGESRSGLAITCLVLVVLLVVVLPIVSIIALIFLGGQVETILSTVGESI